MNIGKLRRKWKLTQVEFAEKLGISQGLVSKLESGTREPSIVLEKLLKEMNKRKGQE